MNQKAKNMITKLPRKAGRRKSGKGAKRVKAKRKPNWWTRYWHARCVCGHLFKEHSTFSDCDHEVGGQCVRNECAARCELKGCSCKYYRAKKRASRVVPCEIVIGRRK